MAVARLGGDFLNERLGAATLIRGGMALVTVALGGVLLIGATVPAVIGFAVCGSSGIANAVPLLFSAAGRLDPPCRFTGRHLHDRLHGLHRSDRR